MSVSILSKRYALSIFNLAKAEGHLENIKQDVLLLKSVLSENRNIVLLLESPIIKANKKISILSAIFKDKVSPITMLFMELVCRKGREKVLQQITDAFINYYHEAYNIQEATVTTPFVSDSVLDQEFAHLVTKISNKKPILHKKINPELIGGFILEVGDKRLNCSIKNELAKVKKTLVED